VCVCVCVRERERKRGEGGEREREFYVLHCIPEVKNNWVVGWLSFLSTHANYVVVNETVL